MVIHFLFTDAPKRDRDFWLVLERHQVDGFGQIAGRTVGQSAGPFPRFHDPSDMRFGWFSRLPVLLADAAEKNQQHQRRQTH